MSALTEKKRQQGTAIEIEEKRHSWFALLSTLKVSKVVHRETKDTDEVKDLVNIVKT